jgi:protein ImuA
MTRAFDRAALISALRARTARLEGAGRIEAGEVPLAAGLPGLARAALHEVVAESPGCGAGFCAVLLARSGGTVLWIGDDGLLAWPPGLAGHGLSPAQLVLVRAGSVADALWAMEEALRCPAVSGVLLSLGVQVTLDLTVTRRLHLAAGTGGALGLLLREDAETGAGSAADQSWRGAGSAAATRWRVAALGASRGLADPRWEIELLRARGGRPAGPWAVTWRAAAGELELDEEGTTSLRATA